MRREIMERILEGCLPIATGFLVGIMLCVVLSLCSCRPTQKIVEVEKLTHDTITVVDTVHIRDTVTEHDSIFQTQYITEIVHDTLQMDVAYKYYTYDTLGNVTSLLDYISSTSQGKTGHKLNVSASSAVSDKDTTHEEISEHNETQGHTEALQGKEQTKVGLTRWQRFLQGMGYAFLAVLALVLMFGGLRLWGKIQKR